jgi:hypothetical protein
VDGRIGIPDGDELEGAAASNGSGAPSQQFVFVWHRGQSHLVAIGSNSEPQKSHVISRIVTAGLRAIKRHAGVVSPPKCYGCATECAPRQHAHL